MKKNVIISSMCFIFSAFLFFSCQQAVIENPETIEEPVATDTEDVAVEKETIPAPPASVSFSGKTSKYSTGKASSSRWTTNPNYRTYGQIDLTIQASKSAYFDHYEIVYGSKSIKTTDKTAKIKTLSLNTYYTVSVYVVDIYGQKSSAVSKRFLTPSK